MVWHNELSYQAMLPGVCALNVPNLLRIWSEDAFRILARDKKSGTKIPVMITVCKIYLPKCSSRYTFFEDDHISTHGLRNLRQYVCSCCSKLFTHSLHTVMTSLFFLNKEQENRTASSISTLHPITTRNGQRHMNRVMHVGDLLYKHFCTVGR